MRTVVFTEKDVLENSFEVSLVGKILVLKLDRLSDEYKSPTYQLWRAYGGFGCEPDKMGTAVFAKCLGDGEEARWERYDFLGILKDELVEKLDKEQFPYL